MNYFPKILRDEIGLKKGLLRHENQIEVFCWANTWKFSTIIRIKATMSPVRQFGSSIEERTLEMFSS